MFVVTPAAVCVTDAAQPDPRMPPSVTAQQSIARATHGLTRRACDIRPPLFHPWLHRNRVAHCESHTECLLSLRHPGGHALCTQSRRLRLQTQGKLSLSVYRMFVTPSNLWGCGFQNRSYHDASGKAVECSLRSPSPGPPGEDSALSQVCPKRFTEQSTANELVWLTGNGGNAGESNPPGVASQHPTTVLKTARPTRAEALPRRTLPGRWSY